MKLDHIALYVQDLEGAKEFFYRFFHAVANKKYHNPKTGLQTYFLTFPDGGRLEIMSREEVTSSEFDLYRQGYIHIAISVGTKEAVNSLTAALANEGYKILSGPRTTGDGYYESCVRAFENNIIEITE